jgi:hypothetical protein
MYNDEHKLKAIHVSMKNDLVSDFFSYYSGYPAITTVETLTNCNLLYIEKQDLENLYNKYKTWEHFGRLVAETAMVEQIMAKINFQTKAPETLYKELVAKNPSILQEVNLGVIAECLSITPETLSRIRARI